MTYTVYQHFIALNGEADAPSHRLSDHEYASMRSATAFVERFVGYIAKRGLTVEWQSADRRTYLIDVPRSPEYKLVWTIGENAQKDVPS